MRLGLLHHLHCGRLHRWAATLALFLAGMSLSLSAQSTVQPTQGWFGAETWTTPAGAVVLAVDPAAPAHQAGLVVRDTIVSVDGKVILTGSQDDWSSRLRHQLTPGRRVTLRVTHDTVRTVTVVGTSRRPTTFPAVGALAPQLDVVRWLNTTGPSRPSRTTFGDGHVYVLDFTANWCIQCPAMYPVLDTLAREYATRGLRVVYATALFWQPQDPDDQTGQDDAFGTLQQYIDMEGVHHPLAVLASVGQIAYSGYFSRTAKEDKGAGGYDVGLPHVIVIDGTGIVRAIPNNDVPALRHALAALLDTSSHVSLPSTPARTVIAVPLHLVNNLPFVSASVDGHTGLWLLDSGGPMILINRKYVQPSAHGPGLDTVTTPYPEDSALAHGSVHVDTTWQADSVLVQLGPLMFPLKHRAGVAVAAPLPKLFEQLWGVKPLGILGFAMVFRGYESVVDYTHRVLTLIPVDSTGRRLVSVPQYIPATTVPFIRHATEGGWFVTAQVGGQLDTMLVDTGENFNKLYTTTPPRLASHVTTTARKVFDDLVQEPVVTVDHLMFAGRTFDNVPFSVSSQRMDGFGTEFFRQLGVVGFNWRARAIVLYR